MVTKENSIALFVKQQIRKWESGPAEKERRQIVPIPVITVSMEPGSGGSLVAREVADRLDFDYFHRDIIEGMAGHFQRQWSKFDARELPQAGRLRIWAATIGSPTRESGMAPDGTRLGNGSIADEIEGSGVRLRDLVDRLIHVGAGLEKCV